MTLNDYLRVDVPPGALSTRKQRAAQHCEKAGPSAQPNRKLRRNAFLIESLTAL